VTASEFAFLAMGLILGVAAGAALVEFIRARPPSPREVRLTVAPDAVPRRRASTLSNDAFTESPVEDAPALGGPADRLDVVPDDGSSWFAPRTPVLEPRPGTIASSPFRLAEPPGTTVVTAQGVPVSSGVDPMLTALRASAAASAQAAMASGTSRSAADTDGIMAAAAALVGGRRECRHVGRRRRPQGHRVWPEGARHEDDERRVGQDRRGVNSSGRTHRADSRSRRLAGRRPDRAVW
jgi:hypothetical protein